MAYCMHTMWMCLAYKWGLVEEKRGGIRRNGERKRERKDPTTSSSDFRHSNCRSSSGRELKFVYSTRATLQEVGIFLL